MADTSEGNPSRLRPQLSIAHNSPEEGKVKSEIREDIPLKAIATHLRAINTFYKKNILPDLLNNPFNNPSLREKYHKWFKGSDDPRSITNMAKAGYMVELNREEIEHTSPERFKQIKQLMGDLTHDAYLSLVGIEQALSDDPDAREEFKHYLGGKYTAEWSTHILESIARQVEEKPVKENFEIKTVTDFLGGFFTEISADDPNLHIKFDCDPGINIYGDKLLFERMIFNPVRNAQKLLAARADKSQAAHIAVKIEKDGPKITVKIHDTAGGLPDRLATNIDFFDDKNRKVHAPAAFARGIKGTEEQAGTGAGLAITYNAAVHEFGGDVKVTNEPYEDTGKKGALFIFTFDEEKLKPPNSTPLPLLQAA